MKLFTATTQGQGDRDNDFHHAIEGELVLCDEVCAADQADPDGGCGCGRAFAGMSSHRATTTAVIRDLDLDVPDVELAVAAYFTSGGLGPEVIGGEDFTDMVEDTVRDVVGRAQWFPVGTVLRRRLDFVTTRP